MSEALISPPPPLAPVDKHIPEAVPPPLRISVDVLTPNARVYRLSSAGQTDSPTTLTMSNSDTATVYQRLIKAARSGYKQSWLRHLHLCIQRQYLLEFTNKGLIISRLVLNLVNGLMTVTVYQFHGNEQYILRLRTALIFHVLMSKVISVVSHIGLFAQDRCARLKGHRVQCRAPFRVFVAGRNQQSLSHHPRPNTSGGAGGYSKGRLEIS